MTLYIWPDILLYPLLSSFLFCITLSTYGKYFRRMRSLILLKSSKNKQSLWTQMYSLISCLANRNLSFSSESWKRLFHLLFGSLFWSAFAQMKYFCRRTKQNQTKNLQSSLQGWYNLCTCLKLSHDLVLNLLNFILFLLVLRLVNK